MIGGSVHMLSCKFYLMEQWVYGRPSTLCMQPPPKWELCVVYLPIDCFENVLNNGHCTRNCLCPHIKSKIKYAFVVLDDDDMCAAQDRKNVLAYLFIFKYRCEHINKDNMSNFRISIEK